MSPSRILRSILLSIPLGQIWVLIPPLQFPPEPGFEFLALSNRAIAQPITPQPNSTNTTTQQVGNQINITGGRTSGDGANLFHSFTQFNVETGQVANFLTHDSIQNILSRVVGGDVSRIDGLIQVLGSNANLFLLNPAGIIFGPNASLNVPAAFTVTTATGIGFDSGWFNALGSNDYTALVGSPNAFAFAPAEPGSIVNAGRLEVQPGKSLTLLGGTVVNTGELTAPGGTITIAAVPGESRVRISQVGHLLNLDIEPLGSGFGVDFASLALPELLTGAGGASATGVEVLPDGTVQLVAPEGVSAPIQVTSGTALVAGKINASGSTPPQVNILGDQIGLGWGCHRCFRVESGRNFADWWGLSWG
ncbi:MAG: filamentous hemagglutinin N-terminal domain-containing protein [Oscillatoriales cyanobacterium RM1_1_9]|nr:filamentous hemagglutinin N-terminal domain-containing protein [Oscillatoriales cyanobacterium RM1_1_9]